MYLWFSETYKHFFLAPRLYCSDCRSFQFIDIKKNLNSAGLSRRKRLCSQGEWIYATIVHVLITLRESGGWWPSGGWGSPWTPCCTLCASLWPRWSSGWTPAMRTMPLEKKTVLNVLSVFMSTKLNVLYIPGRHWVMMEKLTQAPTYSVSNIEADRAVNTQTFPWWITVNAVYYLICVIWAGYKEKQPREGVLCWHRKPSDPGSWKTNKQDPCFHGGSTKIMLACILAWF